MKVFVDLEGEAFVRDHLRVNVTLRSESYIYKASSGVLYLDWAVKVI